MSYYVDDQKITLPDLKNRLRDTDLIPSRQALLEDIENCFEKLQNNSIHSLADLRKILKTPKTMIALSDHSKISIEYLTLLRREIESFFPRAVQLREFEWLDSGLISALGGHGYSDAKSLFEAGEDLAKRQEIVNSPGVGGTFFEELMVLVDLSRIQWVSPTFAGVLFHSGYFSAKAIASAEAEKLFADVELTNHDNRYFKGKVGLRDIARVIKAASYLT